MPLCPSCLSDAEVTNRDIGFSISLMDWFNRQDILWLYSQAESVQECSRCGCTFPEQDDG